jgi:L-lactate dehydrogenase complex protein LldG
MSGAREEILAAIRAGRARRTAFDGRVSGGVVGQLPERAGEELRRRFVERARAAAATVAEADTAAAVPEAVARYLAEQGLPLQAVLGDALPAIPWQACARLQCNARPLRVDGDVLVTGCFAAIADAGAVVLAAGPGQASEAPILAATHVVIVEAGQVVSSLDVLWARLRAAYGAGQWPRSVTLILGPSRTADLGVPSRLGAHGPLRVHVIVVGEP